MFLFLGVNDARYCYEVFTSLVWLTPHQISITFLSMKQISAKSYPGLTHSARVNALTENNVKFIKSNTKGNHNCMGLFNWGNKSTETVEKNNTTKISIADIDLQNPHTQPDDYGITVIVAIANLLNKSNLNHPGMFTNLHDIESLDDIRFASIQSSTHLSIDEIDNVYRHVLFELHKLLPIDNNLKEQLDELSLDQTLESMITMIVRVPATYPEFQNYMNQLISLLNSLTTTIKSLENDLFKKQVSHHEFYEFSLPLLIKYSANTKTTNKINNYFDELKLVFINLDIIYNNQTNNMYHYNKNTMTDELILDLEEPASKTEDNIASEANDEN